MATTKRPIYKLAVGDQKTINMELGMNETHWKPILMSAFPFEKATPHGTLFAVIMERIGPEDGSQ